MKLKIKFIPGKVSGFIPRILDKGDWVDLASDEYVKLDHKGDMKYISLGIAMEIPKGYEAIVAPRSSTAKNFGFIMPNSFGVIDNSYCSDSDIWKCPAYCIKTGGTVINIGDRICQFRIQLSQKATIWQKIKWLFTSGIEFVEVESLNNPVRGGFGSTGIN